MDVSELHRIAKSHYWDDRDLKAARRLLESGIELARALERHDEEKAMNYNLASFCWPGWDEAGIAISTDDLDAGEAAAAENLRLAIELKKGDGPLANAWFMIGAYHLARSRYSEADDAFQRYHEAAERTEKSDQVLLAEGYRLLSAELRDGRADVAPIARRLRGEGGEHGEAFAEQLETVARVFGNPDRSPKVEDV